MTVGRRVGGRGLLAAVAGLAGLCACVDDGAAGDGDGGTSTSGSAVAWPDGDEEAPTACLLGSATAELSVASIEKVDLLFAVDDSASMAKSKRRCAHSFRG